MKILITGGAGFLGRELVKVILKGRFGKYQEIRVFSRDEAKHHSFRMELSKSKQTEEIIYKDGKIKFIVGDIRDYNAIEKATEGVDLVIHASALKQVPVCEIYPMEAVYTNILGSYNLIRACQKNKVKKVIGISSDKACEPITVYGMTKAIMERLFQNAKGKTNFTLVRYGNVISSIGSVVPLFEYQKENNLPITVTHKDMKRFFIDVSFAVDMIIWAYKHGKSGEIATPDLKPVSIDDLARKYGKVIYTGIRPNEKIEEILVSDVEKKNTHQRGKYKVIRSIL